MNVRGTHSRHRYLCDHCGAALPPPRLAVRSEPKDGESFEVYVY